MKTNFDIQTKTKMEIYNVPNDINLFGVQVKTFPQGIKEAFEELVKLYGCAGMERSYYGLSEIAKDGSICYYAMAEEIVSGEAENKNYERYTIEKGNYLTETIKHWQTKTECIKDVFAELMKDTRYDPAKRCVEWYKNNEEMSCMIKLQEVTT